MAKVVLLEHKLREDRLVPVKGAEPLELDGPDYCALLTTIPKSDRLNPRERHTRLAEISKLRQVRQGSFVGFITGRGGRKTNFLLTNTDPSSNSIEWLLRRDPFLGSRLHELYRVIEVDWEQGSLSEFGVIK